MRVCMINEEHGQQKTTVVLQAFVPSVLQHTREGLKKNIFFLRKCFEILNILQKCFSGLSAAGLHPSAGPARPGPEPTNSAPSWGPKKRRVFEHIPWGSMAPCDPPSHPPRFLCGTVLCHRSGPRPQCLALRDKCRPHRRAGIGTPHSGL